MSKENASSLSTEIGKVFTHETRPDSFGNVHGCKTSGDAIALLNAANAGIDQLAAKFEHFAQQMEDLKGMSDDAKKRWAPLLTSNDAELDTARANVRKYFRANLKGYVASLDKYSDETFGKMQLAEMRECINAGTAIYNLAKFPTRNS